MEKIDHKLTRRVYGLRIVTVVFGIISFFNVISTVISPTFNLDFVIKTYTLINLFYFLYFGFVYQYLTTKNYNIFLILTIFAIFIFYLSVDYLNELDNQFTRMGLGLGRGSDQFILFPLILLIASTLFQRPQVVIMFIFFFTCILIYKYYPVIINENTFFSSDWQTILGDGNAIDTNFFGFAVNVWIIAAILCWSIVYISDKLFNDVIKFEKSTAQFSKYFSPAIREKIQDQNFDILSNKNDQMVAVLFTDIVGFTGISEKLEPNEVIKLLSEYQDRMIKPIFQNAGTVDKFIGDAVMATFGTPVSQGNDAQNAFNCARDMQISMRQWAKERSELKLPIIKHRIGIHFGNCIVGNVGNDELTEFTVIGDVVNVASRVCEANKDLDSEFLITESLKLRLNEDIKTKEIKNYEIRGKKEKQTLHIINV